MRIFQVDAFTDMLFRGNPAAVVPLDAEYNAASESHGWPDEALMQTIAGENNLSETAFLLPDPGNPDVNAHIRWFTPTVEVDLCGHATVASAHVLWTELGAADGELTLHSPRSGLLPVRRTDDGLIELDFPAQPSSSADGSPEAQAIAAALGAKPTTVLRSKWDFVAVYEIEAQVAALTPDHRALAGTECRGVIATAPSATPERDFVSRFFGPGSGVDEDPATGSAHCVLTPYWAERLGKDELRAQQISRRVGTLRLASRGERVRIAGGAVTYLRGTIETG